MIPKIKNMVVAEKIDISLDLPDTICTSQEHNFVLGPFYVNLATTDNEPYVFNLSSIVNVYHCTKCGILVLGKVARKAFGSSIDSSIELKDKVS